MAPELFQYLASDNKSTTSALKKPVDVFALGTLIYEVLPRSVYAKSRCSTHQQVLTGQRPFHGRDRAVVKYFASKGEKLERPSWTSIPNHPAWDMVERCRAKKPEDRPELIEVLDCLARASKVPPKRWLSPPSRPQSSSRATPMSSSPVLSLVPVISRLQLGARSLLKGATVQLLGYVDGSKSRWRVMEGRIKKQAPRPKKRNSS